MERRRMVGRLPVAVLAGTLALALALALAGGAALSQEGCDAPDTPETERTDQIVNDTLGTERTEQVLTDEATTEQEGCDDSDTPETELTEQIVTDEATIEVAWLDANGEEGVETYTLSADELATGQAESEPSSGGDADLTEHPAKA